MRTSRALAALFLVVLASSAWAWWLIAWPLLVLSSAGRHVGHFWLVYAHMLTGTVMLTSGAANLYVGWTRRQFRWHRPLGYAYLGCGTIAAIIAFLLALTGHAKGATTLVFDVDQVSDVGIGLARLATAWLVASAMAFRAARNRRFDAHRDWMIRSYVLTWSFVLCRLAGRVHALAALGDGSAIIWLSWVVPLAICEVALQWSATEARGRVPAAA